MNGFTYQSHEDLQQEINAAEHRDLSEQREERRKYWAEFMELNRKLCEEVKRNRNEHS